MTDLHGQVAIVAGASRGVGRAYAHALARKGARVVGLARQIGDPSDTQGSLAETAASARTNGWDMMPMACDIADGEAIARVMAGVVGTHGGIDILVANAVAAITPLEALDISRAAWRATFETNVYGTYDLIRHAVPAMRRRGGGAVVVITSGAGGRTVKGTEAHDGYLAYGVSKAALNKMTQWTAAQWADDNIAVNAVSPGHVARYIASGRAPDLAFWGDPVVHLAGQRPREGGLTGEILHSYDFGGAWGPQGRAQDFDSEIRAILSEAGYRAQGARA